MVVRDVRVREDDLVDALGRDDVDELGLGPDGDAVGVTGPGELGRVAAVVDAGDLRRREGHDLRAPVGAKDGVEVVEIASAGSGDDDPTYHRAVHRLIGFRQIDTWPVLSPVNGVRRQSAQRCSSSRPAIRAISSNSTA